LKPDQNPTSFTTKGHEGKTKAHEGETDPRISEKIETALAPPTRSDDGKTRIQYQSRLISGPDYRFHL